MYNDREMIMSKTVDEKEEEEEELELELRKQLDYDPV